MTPAPIISEVSEICSYLREGTSVALISGELNGNSEVCEQVVQTLEETGNSVRYSQTNHILGGQPFSGLEQLGVTLPLRPNMDSKEPTVISLASQITRELLNGVKPIVVISDIDTLDRESLAVIDMVTRRVDLTLLVTWTTPESWRDPRDAQMVLRWVRQIVHLNPLPFERVGLVCEKILGWAVSTDVVMSILTLSAGHQELVERIARSYKKHGNIVLKDEVWEFSGKGLWNSEMETLAELLLAPFSFADRESLVTLSSLPPQPFSAYLDLFSSQTLEEIETRGLITTVPGSELDGEATSIAISPPLLGEYAENQAPAAKRTRLLSWIETSNPSQSVASITATPITPLNTIPYHSTAENVALSRQISARVEQNKKKLWMSWDKSPTFTNAVAYLEAVWDTDIDTDSVEAIMNTAFDVSTSTPDTLLAFAQMKAEWLAVLRDDPTGAFQLLDSVAASNPSIASEALAYRDFLHAITQSLPADYESRLLSLRPVDPDRSIVRPVLAFLYLLDLRPRKALEVLETVKPTPPDAFPVANVQEMTRALALHLTGSTEEAILTCTTGLETARSRLDNVSISTLSYAAALILLQQGRWRSAEEIISTAISVGKSGLVTAPLYSSLLRLDAVIAARTHRISLANSLSDAAALDLPYSWALPGTNPEISDATRLLGAGFTPENTYAAGQIIDKSIAASTKKGYSFATLGTLGYRLSIYPDESAAAQFSQLVEDRNLTSLAQLSRLYTAVSNKNAHRALELARTYTADGTESSAAQALKAGTNRAKREGDSELLAIFVDAFRALHALYPKTVDIIGPQIRTEPTQVLSPREREIALLAGTLSNSEIAERLDISSRTVENHISNALRKAGLNSRAELSRHVQEAPNT